MSEKDQLLVAQAKAGDRQAFAALVEEYSGPIYGLILKMVRGKKEEAEDLTQEVLLRAFRALPKFRGDAKFSTWIHRIAVNLTLNRIRKKKLQQTSLSQSDSEGEERWLEIPDTTFGPEPLAQRGETLSALRQALSEMSENLRQVFILRELHGMSHDDIAVALGSTSKAVRVRHHRAKKELVRRLRPYLEANESSGV